MDVIVCLKAVRASPTGFSISEKGDRLICEGQSVVVDELGEYALEEALYLKKTIGGTVTVITAGPLSAQHVLYVSKAKGADRCLRINADFADPAVVSEILARAITRLSYDLVLTGAESNDAMTGQTGIALAERLGLPFAYAVTKVDARPQARTVTVEKEVGGGRYQILELALPALLCVQSGIQPLSHAPLAKILLARRESLQSTALSSLDLDEEELGHRSRFRLIEAFIPKSSSRADIIEGDSAGVARDVVAKIREVL